MASKQPRGAPTVPSIEPARVKRCFGTDEADFRTTRHFNIDFQCQSRCCLEAWVTRAWWCGRSRAARAGSHVLQVVGVPFIDLAKLVMNLIHSIYNVSRLYTKAGQNG
jgi:hypothetical protein